MGKSSIWPQAFAAAAASLIMLCNGFHYGWISPIVSMTQDEHLNVSMTMSQISMMSLFLPIGGCSGAIFAFFLVDIIGRRPTLLLMAISSIVSCALIVVAKAYWMFYIARYLAGLCFGVGLTVTPMYVGEISEGRIRGGLCVLMFVMLHVGQLLISAIVSWTILAQAIVGATISVVFATALLWAPESPYYYAMKRNRNQLRKSLAWLRGTPDVLREEQEIEENIALNRRSGVNFTNLFIISSNRKAFFVIMGLTTGRHLSGILVFSFYITKFWQIAEIDIDHQLQVIILSSIQVVISIFVAFLVDKVGRRPLLLTSVSLCTVFVLAETLYSQLEVVGIDVAGIWWLPLVASIGYFTSFSIGLQNLPSVIAAEIFPCEVKAFALGIFTAYSYIILCIFSQLVSLAMYHLGLHILCSISAACSILLTIFVCLCVPETKGFSLSEIQTSRQKRLKTQF